MRLPRLDRAILVLLSAALLFTSVVGCVNAPIRETSSARLDGIYGQRASFAAAPGAFGEAARESAAAADEPVSEAGRGDGAAICVVLGVVALVGIGVAVAASDRDTARGIAHGWHVACGCR